MLTLLATAKAYINFARELRGFLRNPITVDDARAIIANQLQNREENFLKTLQTNVFDHPPSPYRRLFDAANITHTDVARMVGQAGLEPTLNELCDAGIYVTFEEIKGRTSVKRGDMEFTVNAADFNSPHPRPIAIGTSGGSTGTPAQSRLNLVHVGQQSIRSLLGYAMYGVADVPAASWRGLFPETDGVSIVLQLAYNGRTLEHWFSSIPFFDRSPRMVFYHTMSYLMVVLARLYGLRVPFPQYVPLDDPLPVAQWAAQRVQQEGACLLRTLVSKGVRISKAAQENDIDLTGCTIWGGGEPPTPAKIAAIEASGAKYIPHFSFSEGGIVGIVCGNPATPDDLHFMASHFAMLQRPITVFDQQIEAFYLTTLFPHTPATLINAQSDDFGIVETRDCGCMLGEMGLNVHMRNVRSYRKLTGEGTTLVGSDMAHIIESVMPARFGGGPLDYQLVEEEDAQGFTKLVLYVDPSVQLESESDVAEAFLEEMQRSMPATRIAATEYRQVDVIQVRREKPFVTSRGKQFPIRTLYQQKKPKADDS